MSAPASVSLAEMLRRTAEGDQAAFRALYGQAGPRLFALCLRMLGSRDQAEDVLQEAFVKIWKNSWQYDPAKGEALAWLATLARHCALDRLRRRPPAAAPLEDAMPEIHAAAGVSTDLGAAHDLSRCLQGLRTDYREAVVLAYVNGFTHEELAARLRRPIGTVKSWVRRGLEQLKGCMEP